MSSKRATVTSRNKRLDWIAAVSGAALLIASQSARATFFSSFPTSDDTIVGQAFDQGANPLGYRPNHIDDRIGTTGPGFFSRIDQQKVFGFPLPVLDSPTISQATFLVANTFTSPAVPFNVDLYGLNVANPDVSGTSLFFEGADDPFQRKLVDDLIKGDNSSPPSAIADVTAFIQSLYTGTTPNQSEAFFRLNPNVPLLLIDSPPAAQNITLETGSMGLIIATVPEPALAGDYNQDSAVDAADYVVWRTGLGTTYTQSDYDVWRANFGATAASSSGATGWASAVAAVPEPATSALVLGALCLFALGSIGLRTGRGRLEFTSATSSLMNAGRRPELTDVKRPRHSSLRRLDGLLGTLVARELSQPHHSFLSIR